MPHAQKNKIWMVSVVTLPNGKKAVYRYAKNKSSGKSKGLIKGGQNNRMKLKKFNPLSGRHEVFEETKFKS